MEVIGGHCGKCGAPYYVPQVWHGVYAPTPRPTCKCWNVNQITVTPDTVPIIPGTSDGFKPNIQILSGDPYNPL